MKAKFRGGPMDRKYSEVQAGQFLMVQAPKYDNIWNALRDPYAPIEYKQGEYARSNMKLKNGATIYVWLGWRNE
jgi:hypothetical protein